MASDQFCRCVVYPLDDVAPPSRRLLASNLRFELQVTNNSIENWFGHQRSASMVEMQNQLAARSFTTSALEVEGHIRSQNLNADER